MPSIRSIHISPVKSLALSEVDSIHVGTKGIENDRRFLVLDSDGKVVSQRQIGKLAQVSSEYSVDSDELTLTFPDGGVVTGRPSPVREIATMLWGRVVPGSVIDGEWSEALSSFCGADLVPDEDHERGRVLRRVSGVGALAGVHRLSHGPDGRGAVVSSGAVQADVPDRRLRAP